MRLQLLCAGLAFSQDQKHVAAAPEDGARPVALTADTIERAGAYPSIIHLTGNVEIQSPVCLPVGPRRKMICDGYTVLKAAEATYNEATGEIEAHGAVKVTPLLHKTR